jgi:uncharacterized membrane protein
MITFLSFYLSGVVLAIMVFKLCNMQSEVVKIQAIGILLSWVAVIWGIVILVCDMLENWKSPKWWTKFDEWIQK